MLAFEPHAAVLRQGATAGNPLLTTEISPSQVVVLSNMSATENAAHFTMPFDSRYLPAGSNLTKPLEVVIWYDGYDIVVAEPRFSIHAAGSTLDSALLAFGNTLVEDYTLLRHNREELGAHLLRELEFLAELLGVV